MMREERNDTLIQLSAFITRLANAEHILLVNHHPREERLECISCTRDVPSCNGADSRCAVDLAQLSESLRTRFCEGATESFTLLPENGLLFRHNNRAALSQAVFPLKDRKSAPFNAIVIELSEKRDFGESEVSMMQNAAYFAIDTLARDNHNRRMIDKLNLLSLASNGLLAESEQNKLDKKLDAIVEKAARILDAELCTLWRVRNGSVAIQTSYSRKGKMPMPQEQISPIASSPDSGITGFIVNELARLKTPVYIDKQRLTELKEERAQVFQKPPDFMPSADTFSELACPILNENEQLVGALFAYNKLDEDGSADGKSSFQKALDGPLIKILCSKINIALQNADQIRRLNRHRLIIESTPDPIIISDQQGKITYINPGAINIFGNLMGRNVLTHYCAENGEITGEEARKIGRALFSAPNQRLTDHEAFFKSVSGETIPVSLSVSRLFDEHGEEDGTIGIAKDLRRFKALSDISQSLLETHETNKILKRITNFCLELLRCRRAYIKTYIERENTLVFRELSSTITGETFPVEITPADAGMTGYSFGNNMPVMAGKLETEPRYGFKPIFPNVQSKLVVPITYEDQSSGKTRRLGILSVDSEEKDAFSSNDLAFLRTLAANAAIAIKNADTIQTQQKHIARLAAFDKVRKTALREHPQQDQIHDALLDAAVDILGLGFAVISTVDREKHEVRVAKARNVAPAFLKIHAHDLASKDIQAWVVRNKKSEYIDGWDDRLDKKIYDDFDHADLVRVFIPIIVRGEVLATFETGIRKNDKKCIEEDEIRTLEQLVNLAASGMKQIQLLTRLQKDIALRTTLENHLEALNQAIVRILDVRTEQEAAHIIFNSLEKIGYKKGMLSLVDDVRKKLESKYANGENWRQISDKLSYSLTGKNILAQALRARSPILSKNSLTDHRWNRKLAKESGILSQYVIPLTVKNDPIGALQIDLSDAQDLVHGDEDVFERKMRILNTFANQCAIAIRNIKQFRMIKNLETNIAETAHEFRGPLHNIMTQVGGLRESLETNEVRENISHFVEIIEEEIYRAKRQVDNSLLLTEHTREAMEFNFREGRIQEIIHICVDSYKLRALERGIRFVLPQSLKNLEAFDFDHDRMKQAITNLIDNAVKYSQYHQFIQLSGCDDGTRINLEVTDRGLGIPADQFETIFAGFQRSNARDEIRYIPGTGLGLKICKEIVERHGGQISVSSVPMSSNARKIEQLQDYKTTFRLTLPKKQRRGDHDQSVIRGR